MLLFSVNGYDIGFTIHRLVHRFIRIPWTHGNMQSTFFPEGEDLFVENGFTKKTIQ